MLLVAASAIVTFVAQRSGGEVISLQSVPIWERIARAAVLYVVYLGKTLWPVNLAAVYPEEPMESFWPALGAVVLLALLTAGAVWGAWRGQRWLAVGWLWYLGMLVPTIGLIQVGTQVMADRFLYLPQIGLCIAVVWGTAHLAGLWPYRRWSSGVEGTLLCPSPLLRFSASPPPRRWLYGLGGALLVAGLMACAWRQTSYWQNDEMLWTHTLARTARNSLAHNNLGLALADRGRVDEAMVHYRKALEIKPDYMEPHFNLGLALADRGQVGEAIAHFQRALEIRPRFDLAHYNLGLALADRGQIDEAIAQFRRALEIRPRFDLAHNNLGLALAERGKFDEAIAHFRKALEIKPDYAEAHYNLGNALADRGTVDEALAHYQKALDLASARNDGPLADVIRARIRLHQPAH